MNRKISFLFSCVLTFAVFLTGCGNNQQAEEPSSDTAISSQYAPSDTESNDMRVRIEADTQVIVFRLNDSPAARSFYEQLPLSIRVEDYAGSEKIFYPPEELDVRNTPMAEGPAGTLAYYEPWGNVAIFYGECGGASGLYELGEAVSGADQIESLTGEIQIEKKDGDTGGEDESANGSSTQSSQQSSENSRPQSEETEAEGMTSSQTEQLPEESSQPQISTPSSSSQTSSEQRPESTTSDEENATMKMSVQVGGSTFTATLEENAAVEALVEMMENGPVTIQMRDYSGFEKVGPLGQSLPTSNQQTTTHAGDIVLYQGNQIVMFYGSNSWSYTRLGHIDDLTGWEEALGSGDVTVTFSLED